MMTRRPDDDDRVDILEHTRPYGGFFQLDHYNLRHRKHDGGWTPPLVREVLERGRTVALLPYDPVRDAVVLIEQFRIGAYTAGLDPWQIEVVAGVIELGEAADDVARRETVEEAGCRVTDMQRIGSILLSSGASSEVAEMFCGRVDSAGVGGIHGLAHEGEDIRVTVVPAGEAIDKVNGGAVMSGYAVIPLQWLALNRERLRAEWS
jgi:ADP-ribose pyrophosphatase